MGQSTPEPKSICHVSKEEAKGETPVIRTNQLSFNEPLHSELPGHIDTLLKSFESVTERLGKQPLFGARIKLQNGYGEYVWKSHDEIYNRVVSLAKTFEEKDFATSLEYEGRKFKAIGVYLKTRMEWLEAWISSWYISGCVIPLYDSLGEDGIEWIVRQAEIKTVITASTFLSKLAKLKLAGKLRTLQNVIYLDDAIEEEKEQLKKAGISLFTYQECLDIGAISKVKLHPKVTPDSLAMLCYTSGTTSNPKGVMLTHRNYISLMEGLRCISFFKPEIGQTALCWLPLAHIFEQFVACAAMSFGFKIGFYSGDITKLVDDLQALHPNYFGSVPRVFNRIYENTNKTASALTGLKKYLYNKGVEAKLARLRKNGTYTHAFYDRFVFSKIRNAVGGKLLLVFVGGAPFAPDIQEMSRVWLGCAVIQGYGQTETTGPALAQQHDDVIPGSLGQPMAHLEAKLIDIPEMNYLSTDQNNGKPEPRGEILMRGPGVALGYFKEPELTKETFGADGWVHTGDVGKLLPQGCLTIIDRRKNIFKLQQVNK